MGVILCKYCQKKNKKYLGCQVYIPKNTRLGLNKKMVLKLITLGLNANQIGKAYDVSFQTVAGLMRK